MVVDVSTFRLYSVSTSWKHLDEVQMLAQLEFVPGQVLYHQKDTLEVVEVDAPHMDLVVDLCKICLFADPANLVVVVVAVADDVVEAVEAVEEVTALAMQDEVERSFVTCSIAPIRYQHSPDYRRPFLQKQLVPYEVVCHLVTTL